MTFRTVMRDPDEPIPVPRRTIQLLPSEMHILPRGTQDGRPSFAFLLSVADGTGVVVANISFQMLFSSLDKRQKSFIENEWNRMKGEPC